MSVSGLTAFSPGLLRISSGLCWQMLKHNYALSKIYGGFMLTNGDSPSWTVVSGLAALILCLNTNNQCFHTYKCLITIFNSGLWLDVFSPTPNNIIQWFHAYKCWIPFSDSGLAAFSPWFIRNIQWWMWPVVSGRAAFQLGIASFTIASTSWCQCQLINT